MRDKIGCSGMEAGIVNTQHMITIDIWISIAS